MRKEWFDRVEIKQYAKDLVLKNLWPAIVPIIAVSGTVFLSCVTLMMSLGVVAAFSYDSNEITAPGLIFFVISLLLMLVMGNYVGSSIVKYYTALVRNPDQVMDSGVITTMRYSFLDGYKLRFKYMFSFLGAQLLIGAILFFIIYDFNVVAELYDRGVASDFAFFASLTLFIGAVIFVTLLSFWILPLFYIINDTTSSGNGRAPLSFMTCVKKSIKLMKGRKFEAFIFKLSFFAWYLFPFLSFFTVPYQTAALSLWMDQLTAEDDEISTL